MLELWRFYLVLDDTLGRGQGKDLGVPGNARLEVLKA